MNLDLSCVSFFFVKQNTAYEMRISDWSSDVCSSDLAGQERGKVAGSDRMADIRQRLHAERLAHGLEAAHHLVPIGVVGGQVDDLLAELRESITADGPGRHMRIERLMERILAPVLDLVDRVRLADRVDRKSVV